jgi:hypothetical protein
MECIFVVLIGILAVIGGLGSRYGGRGAAAGFVFVVWGLVLLFCLFTPPVEWLFLFAIAALLAIVAAVILKSRHVAIVLLLATTAAGVFFGVMWRGRSREMDALADKYSAVSIADRLAYEARGREPAVSNAPTAAAAVAADSDEPALPEPIEHELTRVEGRMRELSTENWRTRHRPYALERLGRLHEQMVYRFTISEGFGVSRMLPGGVRREYIEIPELPNLAVPETGEPGYEEPPSVAGNGPAELAAAEGERTAAPDRDELRTVHEAGVADFANPAGFGYVASREQVFGFQSHGFRTFPSLGGGNEAQASWRIASLELVSLLKHETPAAYVSKNLPRMDELAQAPTRLLDEFETNALRQLRSGEELVVEDLAGELRMLGSLRAAKQCTECHAVQRGDLLGAFTYLLRRADSPRRRQPAAAKSVL